jgi:hypothetical protein
MSALRNPGLIAARQTGSVLRNAMARNSTHAHVTFHPRPDLPGFELRYSPLRRPRLPQTHPRRLLRGAGGVRGKRLQPGRRILRTAPGDVVCINPGEVHACTPRPRLGMIYPHGLPGPGLDRLAWARKFSARGPGLPVRVCPSCATRTSSSLFAPVPGHGGRGRGLGEESLLFSRSGRFSPGFRRIARRSGRRRKRGGQGGCGSFWRPTRRPG